MRYALPAFVLSALIAVPHAAAEDIAPPPEKAAAGANAGFAVELYQQLAGAQGNVFFSPVNIAAALQLLDMGAEGETAAQIGRVLHGDGDGGDLFALLDAIDPPEDAKYELSTAEALWLQEGYPFKADYLEAVKARDAKAEAIDFRDGGQAAKTINGWVEQQTNDRIKNLIPESAINADTRMVITTAIYFLGTWADTFDKDRTRDRDFTLASGETIQHPIMGEGNKRIGYFEDDAVQVAKLPYKGGDAAMVVVLPKEADGLAAVEEQLTAERLSTWAGRARTRKVHTYLPKWEMTVDTGLNAPLKALGVTHAFDAGKADFGGMTDSAEKLFVSKAIHKAFIKVDEQGTEAAAATGIMLEATSAMIDEPPTFNADHPFLFAIVHEHTGAVLFMGRVMDPR